jgi:hypothetical protein
MDVVTLARDRDRSWVFTRERAGRSTKDSLEGLDLGGSFPFHLYVGLGSPMTSPNILDTLEAVVCQVERVARSRGPRRPNVLL